MTQDFAAAFIGSADQIDPTIVLGASLESANYVPHVSGYRLDYATGNVEFGSGEFRGDLQIGSVAAGPLAALADIETAGGILTVREGALFLDTSTVTGLTVRNVTAGPTYQVVGTIGTDTFPDQDDLRISGTNAIRIEAEDELNLHGDTSGNGQVASLTAGAGVNASSSLILRNTGRRFVLDYGIPVPGRQGLLAPIIGTTPGSGSGVVECQIGLSNTTVTNGAAGTCSPVVFPVAFSNACWWASVAPIGYPRIYLAGVPTASQLTPAVGPGEYGTSTVLTLAWIAYGR